MKYGPTSWCYSTTACGCQANQDTLVLLSLFATSTHLPCKLPQHGPLVRKLTWHHPGLNCSLLFCSRVSTPVKRKNRDYSARDYGSGQINAYPPVAPGGAVAGAAMMSLAEELLTKKGLSLKDLQVSSWQKKTATEQHSSLQQGSLQCKHMQQGGLRLHSLQLELAYYTTAHLRSRIFFRTSRQIW